jgi:hypothetical protein
VEAVRIGLLTLVLFAALVPAANACKCAPPGDPVEEVAQADAAVFGKVVRVNAFSIYGVSYRLRVKRDYKDNLGRHVLVLTAGESAACGLVLRKGDRVGLLLKRSAGSWDGYSCGVRSRRFLRRGAAGAKTAAAAASPCSG